jgi:hypothetical protein
VQIAWSGPCFDPPGDLYYSCFVLPKDPKQPFPLADFAFGDATSFAMPATYLDSDGNSAPLIRPSTTENNSPYGIAYVFFAACAGQLVPIPTSDATAFPLGCQDAAGKLLGSDDFVAGYTAIYSYEKFTNHNPVISGFEFLGQALDATAFCIGNDCQASAEATPPADDSIDCDNPDQSLRCIPSCADDGKKPCPGYAIQPTIDKTDPANQDQDDVSVQQTGHATGEQMWIDYYTDGGGFKSSVRLLNDATTGWNDDYGTEFYAGKDAKVSRIWALAHDNRGGVAWAGITLKTQ